LTTNAAAVSGRLRFDLSEARRLDHLGTLHANAGRIEDAIAAYRRAVAACGSFALAHFHLGFALHRMGRPAQAESSYRRAIELAPELVDARHNLGVALQQLRKHSEAEALFRQVLSCNPRSATAHFHLGVSLAAQNRLDAAIVALREASTIHPEAASVHLHLGMALQQNQELPEAATCYRRAVELEPSLAVAIHNLGYVLRDLGQLDEAIHWFRRAATLHPDAPLAHRALAVALRDRGFISEAFAAFRRCAELTLSRPTPHADCSIPTHRLKHDREQLDYLADNSRLPAAGARRDEMARAPLTSERFHERFVALYHIEGGEQVEPLAISARDDGTAIERQWAEGRPRIVVVDDLLSPPALEQVRRFCRGSTIWRNEYRDGYLGTMMENGFAQPLILQIAEELAAAFPKIFRRLPLMQAWGFKYDSALGGIGVHADFAEINVNFWIAPNEANRDPNSGGLVIWNQPAPLAWDFAKYNKDTWAIRAFLANSGARPVTVPHRANRAVIFDSDLFHETDGIAFEEGYLNRRINITLLYGRRERRVACEREA
jgi:tetratricopeptide (TPR) repeat protein